MTKKTDLGDRIEAKHMIALTPPSQEFEATLPAVVELAGDHSLSKCYQDASYRVLQNP